MLPSEEHSSPIFNALMTSAALVVVVAGIHAARGIVIPLLLAVFIAVILSAIMAWLRERRINPGIAVFLMIVILGVMGSLMVLVVGASVNELIRKLPQINAAVQLQEQKISQWLEDRGLTTEKPAQKDGASRFLEISVPGLLPAPEKGKTDAQPDEDKTGAEPAEKPASSPQTGTETSPTPQPSASGESSPASAQENQANSGTDREGSPPLPTTPPQNSETAFPESTPEENLPPSEMPETEELPAVSANDLPIPELSPPPRYELPYPNYIFGPQRHVIEFPANTASSQVQSPYGGYLEFYSPVQIFRTFLDGVMGMFNYGLVVFLMLMFLLLEWSRFGQKLEKLPGNTQSYVEQVSEILASIRRYMFIKTLVSLLTGLLIAIWLMILGTDYAALWGTVAFLFNYIPTIGSIIAGVVPTLFVLVDQGPVEALWVGIAFLVVNFLIGNILEPRIMGEGLGLSTFVVFLSLVFWGFILGPVGMLLAVPLTMAIKIALASEERTRWIALLLGSGTKYDTVKTMGHKTVQDHTA